MTANDCAGSIFFLQKDLRNLVVSTKSSTFAAQNDYGLFGAVTGTTINDFINRAIINEQNKVTL